MILEDDERDISDPITDSEATYNSINAGPAPAFELSQCADPSDRELWWDVEEGCFVYADLHPHPPLEYEGLASTPAQDRPTSRRHSLGVTQDETNPHGDNRTMRSASEESAVQSLLMTLDENSGGESEENVPDLERDMQLVLEGQEELLATPPSIARPRRSAGLSQPPVDQYCDQGWSEELRSSSRLRPQNEEKEGHSGQEQEEMAADETRREAVDREPGEADDDEPLQNQGNSHLQAETTRTRTEEARDASQVRTLAEGKKILVARQGAEGAREERQHEGKQDTVRLMEGREMQRQQQHGEGSELEGEDEEFEELAMEGCSHNGEEEGGSDNPGDEDYDCDSIDEEDEDIRPAKRRRLPSRISDEGLEVRGQQSSKPYVTLTHRSSSTATERSHARPETMHTHARDSTVNEQLHTPHPSRSPSAATTEASGLAAVYQEWPLHGFLKSTRIGNNTTFNLDFHLVGVPEHLELSAPFMAWRNNGQSPIQPHKPHSTTANSKTRNCQSTPPRKRAPWTTEEDATLVKMKKENCSWEEISAALSSHSQGSIQVRYSTKFSKRSSAGTRSRKRQRP